jgi:hypothetical protein
MKNRFLFIAGYTSMICMILLAGQSCTKTELVQYEREPSNRMLEYKIVNTPEVLYGVVDDIDNSISVYIPYYLSIDYIVPQIKLQDGAKLIDAAGNEIDLREDLDPVHIDSAGYQYRVKDAGNIVRTYTLKAEILPYITPLHLGYSLKQDANGNLIADSTATSDALVNSQILVYGNFESSSSNGKISLLKRSTNEVIPNGVQIVNVTRAQQYHYMTVNISPDIDSGYYRIAIEHQGRRDTLPVIHLTFRKPYFQWLPKACAVNDTVTLNITAGNGVNTGVKKVYAKLIKRHYDFPGSYVPENFPQELFDVPVELQIISQNRTQIKFKFPSLPIGYYSTFISGSANSLIDSGFGFYFDFNSEAWGNNNILSSAPYLFEITPAKP